MVPINSIISASVAMSAGRTVANSSAIRNAAVKNSGCTTENKKNTPSIDNIETKSKKGFFARLFRKRKNTEAIASEPSEPPKAPTVFTVYLEDEYFDMITDNDDLEDEATIIKVTYNDKGEILSSEFPTEICYEYSDFVSYRKFKHKSDMSEYHRESSLSRQKHFFQTCNIKPHEYKKYTAYKKF